MKKIGIMGGTFDPIHMGHLILAQSAKEQYRLDEIWVMPNGNPKYKSGHQVTDVTHRVEMVRLAIDKNPNLVLSTTEAYREGYTYTCETLEQLQKDFPEYEFYFIIGADSLFSFDKWKNPEQIAKACILLTANRNHVPDDELSLQIKHLEEKYHAVIRQVQIPSIDISSNMLRNKIHAGQSVRYFVPEETYEYIQKHKLYTTP